VKVTPTGLQTADADYEFDAIVFATGFDAMTGAVLAIGITGRDGVRLRDKWSDGPRAYLGLCVAGFPNMFVITGPGSPSALSNMIVSIEQHVDWLAACIARMADRGFDVVEATQEAEDAWVAHVDDLAHETLYPVANSWYVGANVVGKPRVFMAYVAGVGEYRRACEEVVANDYRGFDFARRPRVTKPS
jgi:cyclohexanone monooxygenase